MSNIKLTSGNKQSGKVVYNKGIVKNIVTLAVAEVEGVIPFEGKKEGVSLYFEKDGVYVDISIIVKYGYNVPELAYRVQQTVKQNVENMTSFKVAEVDVHIQDVLFVDAPVEKEEAPKETVSPAMKEVERAEQKTENNKKE